MAAQLKSMFIILIGSLLLLVSPVAAEIAKEDISEFDPGDIDAQEEPVIEPDSLLPSFMLSFVGGDEVDPEEDVVIRQDMRPPPQGELCNTWTVTLLNDPSDPVYIVTSLEGPDGEISKEEEAFFCDGTYSTISRMFEAPSEPGEYDYFYRWHVGDGGSFSTVFSDPVTIDASDQTLTVVGDDPEPQPPSNGDDDDDDDRNGDTDPQPEPEADISYSSTPSFNVNQDEGTVTGTATLQNTGDGNMDQSNIMEMQVRPQGMSPLSWVAPSGVSEQTCDPDEPNNIYQEYFIESGDSVDLELKASDLDRGETYDVYFLTRDECYGDDGNERVDPEPQSHLAGSFTLEDDSDEVSDPAQPANIEEKASPQVSYDSESNAITTEVSFKNTGGDMPEEHIVEMQITEGDAPPLSFLNNVPTLSGFDDVRRICDTDHPENVHKEFQLEAGESDTTELTTTAVTEDGEYRVYLLTRDECFGDDGNERVDPYPQSQLAGTIELGDGGDTGTVEPSPGQQSGFLTTLLIVLGVGLLAVIGYRRIS